MASTPDPVQERDAVRRVVLAAQDLVVRCARTRLTDRQVETIRRQARHTENWGLVVRLAVAHGVQPVVYRTLKDNCADLLSEEMQREIERYERMGTIRNTFLAEELGRVLERFENNGIPALPLKGPVLAQVAYGDIHLRWYTDLDVLIPPRHFSQVEKILVEGEYVPFEKVKHLTGLKREIYYYLSGQWPFKRGNGVFNLDVHAQVMPPGYHYPIAFEEFWERSHSVSLGPVTVPRFATEDMLQILCFHGAKNQWSRLKYVCDVAELIGAETSLDWTTVVDRAHAIHGVRVLALGVLLARRVLDAPVPEDVLDRLSPNASLERLAGKLEDKLVGDIPRASLSYEDRVELQWLLQDTWSNKMRYSLYSCARNVWDAWIK